MASLPAIALNAKFSIGQVVSTPGALKAIGAAGQCPSDFLNRHVMGEWGNLDAEDRQANVEALAHGARIMSVYRTL